MIELRFGDIKEGYYLIDECGNVFSLFSNEYMHPGKTTNGYLFLPLRCVHEKKHNFFIHRLVMMFFNPIEGMEDLEVNHIDGNKENNSLDNLEWCTTSENHKHAFKIGLKSNMGQKMPRQKLTDENVLDIFYRSINGEKTSIIAKDYNISVALVQFIKTGKRYSYLTGIPNTRKY